MHVLKREELGIFVQELKDRWPQSLNTYMLAYNHLHCNQFAWPGIEFIVDKFPNHTASLVRPGSGAEEDFPPRHLYGLHSVDAVSSEALKKFLETPGVVDWSEPMFFAPVSRTICDTFYDTCREHGKAIGHVEQLDFQSNVLLFKPENLKPCPDLPEGFTLASLRRHHMAQVNMIWTKGLSEMTLEYMLYLFDSGFPTLGAFTPDGELAGYVLTSADMLMFAAYVFPEHRNKKLFHILTYNWCQKMYGLGVELPYCLVSDPNVRSRAALARVGAERSSFNLIWALFVPPTGVAQSDARQKLLEWYEVVKRSEIIWKL